MVAPASESAAGQGAGLGGKGNEVLLVGQHSQHAKVVKWVSGSSDGGSLCLWLDV